MINEQKRISGNTAMQTELKLLQTTGLWPMFEIVRGLGRGNLRMLHEEKAPERNCRRRRHIRCHRHYRRYFICFTAEIGQ